MLLSTSIEHIKGVGVKTYSQFQQAGLTTVGDLITFLPRRHDDFSQTVTIDQIKPGNATIKARCEAISTRQVRRGLRITTATLADDTGKLKAVWFNQPYRATQLKATKDEFYFSGNFEFTYNRYQLTNPSAEKVSEMPVQTDRVLPVYRSIKGLKPHLVRKIVAELKPLITMLPETLPSEIVTKYELLSRSQALMCMHFPSSPQDIAAARRRLGFEELFQLLLASQYNKNEQQKLSGYSVPFEQGIVKDYVAQLPFTLTDSQRLASWQILQDLESTTPMNRLLQGDVGSGKTVVASLAARQVVEAGLQVAFMAPTEILARQHADTLSGLLEPFGVTVGLLTGSVKAQSRRTIEQHLKAGDINVIVGTHALFQKNVEFHNLGLVVIDEQHRFGVKQRQDLLAKSKRMPHLLAMTATPIPRSLALTVYGELDVSVLRDRPKGRLPIKTHLWSPDSRAQLYETVRKELMAGRQAYVVCSLIDDNPDNDTKSVESEYKRLKAVFKQSAIGLLHGKLSSEEKSHIMEQFQNKAIDILVSTTVVEVGVDVPNATVMIIENADRFGLSQLHQLRGRVGRSDLQSYCYLVLSDSQKPSQRLREIEKSNDGFYLAEVDLQLRGPGEIYGKAQHGALNLEVASLGDTRLIAQAQQAARQFVASGDDLLHYEQLASSVQYYQRLTTLN